MLERVPVNDDADDTEDVAAEHGKQRDQIVIRRAVRHLEFQHHDGDDAVAEVFQPGFAHQFLRLSAPLASMQKLACRGKFYRASLLPTENRWFLDVIVSSLRIDTSHFLQP